jgi:hypothetical protein
MMVSVVRVRVPLGRSFVVFRLSVFVFFIDLSRGILFKEGLAGPEAAFCAYSRKKSEGGAIVDTTQPMP